MDKNKQIFYRARLFCTQNAWDKFKKYCAYFSFCMSHLWKYSRIPIKFYIENLRYESQREFKFCL